MDFDPDSWRERMAGAGEWERGALPGDGEDREACLAFLEGLRLSGESRVFPWGLDPRASGLALWEPYRQARDRVERYAEDPQEPGCRVDWLIWDPRARWLALGLLRPALPSSCPRFASRRCPLMTGSGAEPSHPECNYWASEGFSGRVPGLELNPEWQRFDCHRHYRLFQCHLVLEELAASLGAGWTLQVLCREARQRALVLEYAALTSRPDWFVCL